MSKTEIEWCKRPGTKPETWNPTTGCNKVSQGCKNCYAEVMHKRLTGMGQAKYAAPFLDGAVIHPREIFRPYDWKQPRTVFVNSMSDLFHDAIGFDFLRELFLVMQQTPQHTYQILTKRPERLLHFYKENEDAFGLPNVWLGTSCEDQQTADERIPLLLQVPAAVRFLSCEPLLGKIDFKEVNFKTPDDVDKWGIPPLTGIDWVIAGGESGHGARPMHPDWVRSLRNQREAAGVSFFFKQWGAWYPEFASISEWDEGLGLMPDRKHFVFGERDSADNLKIIMTRMDKKDSGRLLDGREWNEWPVAAS